MKKLCVIALLAIACSKSSADGSSGAAPSASAGHESTPPPSASGGGATAPKASASATPPPSSSASTVSAATYGGSYNTAAKNIYIAETKEFGSVKQAKDDPSKMMGEGAMTVNIGSDGRVSGTIDSGPAAPAVIEGATNAERVTASVRRKDVGDHGLVGTLSATTSAVGLDGVLVLSEANAAVVREAKFALKKK